MNTSNIKHINEWVARRANHASGFYLEKFEDGIKIGRAPSDTLGNEIAAVTLIKSNRVNNTLSFDVSCGLESVGLIKWCTIECFSVDNNYKITDPFKVLTTPDNDFTLLNKTHPYKITVNELNKKIKIQCPFEFHNLVLRIKISFIDNVISRLSDYITISNLNTYSTDDKFNKLISNDDIFEDIITPNVRLIRKKASEKLIISFSPVNFPINKYNTLDMFHGLDGSRLLINDAESQWYMNGVPKLGNTTDEFIASINKILEILNPKHITTFGTSMGAYGAILIGCITKSDHVVAFNPELILFTDSSRRSRFIEDKKHGYNELLSLIENNEKRLDLFFSKRDPIDLLMLKTSKSLKSENLYIYEMESKHNIGEHINIDYYWLSSLLENSNIEPNLLPKFISPIPIK